MLFLAEHHAIRLIAAEPCAHLESVAYLLNILEIMPCEKGGFVGRSPENSAHKRLEKRFSGRLVLERSRSNGGLFSCCMLDGWKTMKQREAGDAYFFFGWRRDSLPLTNPAVQFLAHRKRILLRGVRTSKSALLGCMGLLQNPVFRGTGLRCNSWPVDMARGVGLVAKASAARVVAR